MTKSSCCKRGSMFDIRISGEFLKNFSYRFYSTTFSRYFVWLNKADSLMTIVAQSSNVAKGPLLVFSNPILIFVLEVYMASSMKSISRSIDGNFKEKKTWKRRTDWFFIYFRKFSNGKFHEGLLFSVVDLIFSFGFFFPIFWSSLGHMINCRSDMWHLNFYLTKSAVACRS